jgi:DNA-binding transcriptional LysR family regulator
MELRQLEYFVAVAEEGGFTRAAQRVHISQSGVSAQIRQLERELGATLIDRSGRTATVTSAGAAILEHARAALASATAVRRAVDDVNGLLRGRVVVGMVTGCTITPLFDALAAFGHAHPDVELALLEDNSERLVERVRTGAADLALVGVAEAPPAGLETLTLVRDGLIAVVPAGHPLARRRHARLADLAGQALIALPPGTGIRAAFDASCARAGVHADVGLEASAPDAVAGLAARGLGVGILSASMAAGLQEGLRAVALRDAGTPALLALVWAPDEGPALRELLVHARAAFTGAARR